MQSTQLTNVQEQMVSVVVKNFNGDVHAVDGVPIWASSDESIIRITPNPDGLSAVITTVGVAGTAQVTVTVDVDTSTSVLTQTGTFTVNVTESGEVTFEFSFGDPTHR